MSSATHKIHTGTTAGYVDIVPGMRVCRWHQTYADQMDPIPGTVVSVGAKFITVDWDSGRRSRIQPQRVDYWDYPPDPPITETREL